MLILIPELLPSAFADQMVSELGALAWHAGDSSDTAYASQVKQNLELKEQDSPVAQKYAQLLLQAILTNPELRSKAFPHKGKLPQFNKYTEGGAYHKHSDSAFMGSPEIRTDLSVTIFLSDPADYDGGELTLEYSSGEVRKVKERKGTLVCYPSGVLHYITPVTRGARYAAITWLQSFIRSPQQRDLLTSLVALSDRVKKQEGLSDNYTDLISIQNNLLRMWSEF
jgi:PKHD-type hydroxylase